MSHNSNIAINKSPANIKYKQKPLTKFIDWLNSIHVELLDWSNPDRIRKVGYISQFATWERTLEDLLYKTNIKTEKDVQQAIINASKGLTLPLNLEMVHFTFIIGGISRITTHQIVRSRIGVTYSQRCSGDQDVRHDDVLVPRDIANDNSCYLQFITQSLEFKNWYAKYADKGRDTGNHSIQTLRSLAPHNLSQFIIVSGSLLAFMGIIGKRLCTYETVEYNKIALEYQRLICSKFPEFKTFLKVDCDKTGGCYHMKVHSPLHGNLYLPDKKHEYEYNINNFVYPYTRAQMVENYPKVSTKYFHGFKEINSTVYDELLKYYAKKNK